MTKAPLCPAGTWLTASSMSVAPEGAGLAALDQHLHEELDLAVRLGAERGELQADQLVAAPLHHLDHPRVDVPGAEIEHRQVDLELELGEQRQVAALELGQHAVVADVADHAARYLGHHD